MNNRILEVNKILRTTNDCLKIREEKYTRLYFDKEAYNNYINGNLDDII